MSAIAWANLVEPSGVNQTLVQSHHKEQAHRSDFGARRILKAVLSATRE
jgi:hypothetical protein